MTTVIVPAFNEADLIGETAAAVLAQECVDEWIWVDDGSVDGTANVIREVIKGEPRARVVVLEANSGRAAARNKGIAASSGDALVFFDADAAPAAGTAHALVEGAFLDGFVASVGTVKPQALSKDDPYHVYLRRYPRGPVAFEPGEPIGWRYMLTCALGIRREALNAVGGFDETVRYGEDLALAQRLSRSFPDGLVKADTSVPLFHMDNLDGALAKVSAFGRDLAAIGYRDPSVYEQMHLDVLQRAGSLRYRLGASCAISASVRAALPILPEAGVASAVRYLLGHHLLVSHARARAAQ